jgi:hypothetical protein
MRGGGIRHSPPARVFFGPLGRMTGMGRIPWETGAGSAPLPPLAPDLGHDEDYSSPRPRSSTP